MGNSSEDKLLKESFTTAPHHQDFLPRKNEDTKDFELPSNLIVCETAEYIDKSEKMDTLCI